MALKALNRKAIDKRIANMKLKRVEPTEQCELAGCNNLITPYTGLGSQTLCYVHQMKLREHGGPSRYDRPWTLHKEGTVCQSCGNDMADLYNNEKDPLVRVVKASRLMDADHKVPPKNIADKKKRSHSCNHKDNIMTICPNCHRKKTQDEQDYL